MERVTTNTRIHGLLAFAVAAVIAFAAMAVSAQPAQASDKYDYSVAVTNMYGGDYGLYAKPGEKVVYKLALRDNESWEYSNQSCTWNFACGISDVTLKGNKLVISKVPKAGTYKITVEATDDDNNTIAKDKLKLVVKKKPAVKIKMQTFKSNGQIASRSTSSVKKGQQMMLMMNGASFGWDYNNTKKPFYTWTVKNLKTGKTATWNAKKGKFNKNAFIGAGSVAGGGSPICMGAFKAKGKYKVTAKVFHNNKAITTVSKTITVK